MAATRNGPLTRRTKGETRRAEILDAAEQQLIRQGAEGLGLRSVARAIGISVGNLQYYFPTRADLLDALFERHTAEFSEELAALTDERASPRTQFEVLVDYWLGVQHTRGQSLFWHLWAISAHDASARTLMTRVYAILQDRICLWLTEIHPGVEHAEASARAAAIASIIEGSGLFVGYGRRPGKRFAGLQDEVRRVAVEIFDRPAG
jgi:AcrR family transcriptional regulator